MLNLHEVDHGLKNGSLRTSETMPPIQFASNRIVGNLGAPLRQAEEEEDEENMDDLADEPVKASEGFDTPRDFSLQNRVSA